MRKILPGLIAGFGMAFIAAGPAHATVTSCPPATLSQSLTESSEITDSLNVGCTVDLGFTVPAGQTWFLDIAIGNTNDYFIVQSQPNVYAPGEDTYSYSAGINPVDYSVDVTLASNVAADPYGGFDLTPTFDLPLNNADFPGVYTPLPPTWTMLLAGLIGLGFCAYQRGKNVSGAIAAA